MTVTEKLFKWAGDTSWKQFTLTLLFILVFSMIVGVACVFAYILNVIISFYPYSWHVLFGIVIVGCIHFMLWKV